MVAVVWFRNDLRISDHLALDAAIKTDQDILPIYIYDQVSSRPLGGASKWWLHRSLSALQENMQACDADIILRKGHSLDVLKKLYDEIKFTHIFWHHRYDNLETKQDCEIQQYNACHSTAR